MVNPVTSLKHLMMLFISAFFLGGGLHFLHLIKDTDSTVGICSTKF